MVASFQHSQRYKKGQIGSHDVFYMLALEVVTHCRFTLFTWLHNSAILNMETTQDVSIRTQGLLGGHEGGW